MKRELRTVDVERGIVQITLPDERWYCRSVMGKDDFVPSVTWIAGHWPKGVGFYKWLASKGWDEAEEIKAAVGDKGSKVHQAISMLLRGGSVSMGDSFTNPRTLQTEELTTAEWECLMSFCEWCAEAKPQIIGNEYTIWNEHYRYAGTVDIRCKLACDNYRAPWIVDVKTSPDIYMPHELQVSAYKHADVDAKKTKLGILQVGYRRNKFKKYKFTPIRDQFGLFLAARKIWEKESGSAVPLQRDFPLSLSLKTEWCLP